TEMLADLDKETVDVAPNFDDRLSEPTVLPSKLPNLLINGSSGIAVGMATNIPPHNLREVVAACVRMIEDPDVTSEQLMEHVRGPDFPTAGYVLGRNGIRDAYTTGRGRIVMRARALVEDDEGAKPRIIVTEIPFMVNKTRLIEQIASLVRERRVEGITDLRDESDREGMRIVIEMRRDVVPQIVLNQLYKHTQMQSTFGTILLALVDGVPRVMDLQQLIRHFLDHRHEVVVRRTQYDLDRALDREHILEGLKIAVDNIDEVVEIIRGSRDADQAGERLRDRFELSERQSKAILDMRLSRLTGLEIEKLDEELEEVRAMIADLRDILGSEDRRYSIVRAELNEMAEKFGDDRRTEILGDFEELTTEDLIADEEMVITVSRAGYIKRLPVGTFRSQRRGGRGLQGMNTKDDDWVEHVFRARTHDVLMFFTRRGQCYWLKVWQIPQAGRAARGKPIVNLLSLDASEQVAALLPVREFSDNRSLVFATLKGVVKKTPLSAYQHMRSVGLNAINISEGDELIDVQVTDGDDEIILATHEGMAIRFHEADARPMGRATTGVRGIRLGAEDHVVGMVVVRRRTAEDATLLTVTERGRGKRSAVDDYRLQKRGGKGVLNFRITDATGRIVAVKEVLPGGELMLISRNGVINRQRADEIRVIGRATQGVRVMALDEGDELVDVARLAREDEDGEIEPGPLGDAATDDAMTSAGPDAGAAADAGTEAALAADVEASGEEVE
ncbi:MAG TPA: DNA gyrase subunit A, partial [Longimicrobiales bacterium]|nr:DNA gyrase subunit A [Longimicrobiales bacterium]